MNKNSFTAPISFLHSQMCCLWTQRLMPIGLSLGLILGAACSYKFYIYRRMQDQVSMLENSLVNFDQAVRDKNNLVGEQKRLEQKLNHFRAQKNINGYSMLLGYLVDIANLIPESLVLSKIELIAGSKIIIEGANNPPNQVIVFWHKLLSLDYVIDGKLKANKSDTQNHNQFILHLKIKQL